MIYHELFGQHLRLGNFLFKYAWSIAKYEQLGELSVYPHEYYLWKYLKVPPLDKLGYSGPFPVSDFLKVNWEWSKKEEERIDNIISNGKSTLVSLDSFFQSEKWFENYKDNVFSSLTFKDEIFNLVFDKHQQLFSKPTIGIGIRLGDFVGHGDFYQIDPDWYISALNAEFPNWEQENNVVIFSDDIVTAKEVFKEFPFFYPEPNGTHVHDDNFKHYHADASEQFILGTMMDNFIIGNSTFSWWQAWLATYNSGKTVHCGKVFTDTGNMKHIDTSNYYCKNWIEHVS